MIQHIPEGYIGRWIAQRAFLDKDIIAMDENIDDLYKKVQRMGVEHPVIFYSYMKGDPKKYYTSVKT